MTLPGDVGPAATRWRGAYGWRLIKLYWTSRDSALAWLMLLALLAATFGSVYIFVWQNAWQGRFFNALEQRNWNGFVSLTVWFFVVAGISIATSAVRGYLNGMLVIRWRAWLTGQYMARWLSNCRFYALEMRATIDNPDQRLAEDLALFTQSTLGIGLGLLQAVASLASFGTILWTLGGGIVVPLGAGGLAIPGYMVWAALLYAALGSWLVVKLSGDLAGRVAIQQRVEANFRYLLVYLRRAAEQVAFFRGEASERTRLGQAFDRVRHNWRDVTVAQVRVASTQGVYSEVGGVLPLLLAMPRYFAGQISFGAVMQTRDAFTQFNSSLSFFVQSYASIANWLAVTHRIRELEEAMNRPHVGGIERQLVPGADVVCRNLSLAHADARSMTAIGDLRLGAGQRWLVTGPSGVGKSTLLRALAGLWPIGEGQVQWPANQRALFITQRPYFPLGTLKEALAYPSAADAFSDADCAAALVRCGLALLADRLNDSVEWDRTLSPGEQQRVAFCRALLQAPDLLFLDEATSALDPPTEQRLYGLLLESLPRSTLVSVAHREALRAFHDHELRLRPGALAEQSAMP